MHSPTSNAELDLAVKKVRAGDSNAFATVINACEQSLRVLVAAILPQVAMVEDVVQKSLVIAYYRLDQYELGTSFTAWLATIARYQALNERRRWLSEQSFKKRLRVERQLDQLLYQNDDHGDLDRDILLPHLTQCLASLRDRSADIVRIHYLESVPIDEIAKRYEQSTDWVHLVLHRARRALRTCLIAKQGEHAHGA